MREKMLRSYNSGVTYRNMAFSLILF